MNKQTRNSKLLKSFVKYCKNNPTQRFWQALLNWSELPYIVVADRPDFEPKVVKKYGLQDTYYWEDKNK